MYDARDPQYDGKFSMVPVRIAFDPRLNSTDRVVISVLAYWAFGDNAEIWHSNEHLASCAGIEISSLVAVLRRLERDHGLISRRETDGNRTGRVITLNWKLPTADRLFTTPSFPPQRQADDFPTCRSTPPSLWINPPPTCRSTPPPRCGSTPLLPADQPPPRCGSTPLLPADQPPPRCGINSGVDREQPESDRGIRQARRHAKQR